MKISINTNAIASLTLTETGARRLNDYFDGIKKNLSTNTLERYGSYFRSDYVCGERYEEQLHDLIDIFGPEFLVGLPTVPFDKNRIEFDLDSQPDSTLINVSDEKKKSMLTPIAEVIDNHLYAIYDGFMHCICAAETWRDLIRNEHGPLLNPDWSTKERVECFFLVLNDDYEGYFDFKDINCLSRVVNDERRS